MRKIQRNALFATLLLSVTAIASASYAQKGSSTFTVLNKTGVVITALYATPHNSDNWGEDILGADVLASNDELGIVFSRKETASLWDLRVENDEGSYIEWENINLREISSVSLYFKNGKATAVFNESMPNLNGTWTGYYDDGSVSPYVWNVRQTGAAISVENIGKGARSRGNGSIKGRDIRIADFATQNGKLSADGNRIVWTDGVVWVRSVEPDLNGVWIGYYDDGTRSPYLWNIGHVGSTINIDDARKPGTSRSRGTIKGNKITALDFATKNGTLSADGRRITWSDGVVWVKE